jgi:hypothetical protein
MWFWLDRPTIRMNLAAPSLNLGAVVRGAAGAEKSLTLRSESGGKVTLKLEPDPDGSFSLPVSGELDLPAGQDINVTVKFAPTTSGPKSAKLHVIAESVSDSYIIDLTGDGIEPPNP